MKKHRVVFWMKKHHAVAGGKSGVTAYEVRMSVTVYAWAANVEEALTVARDLDYVQQLTGIVKVEAQAVD